MVRLKDRYLLVTIVYADDPGAQQKSNTKASQQQPQEPVSDLLLFNQPTTDDLSSQTLLKAIRSQVNTLFGDCGSGAIDKSLQVKYLSPATSTFILRVSRAYYRLVWAALTFMDSVPTRSPRRCMYRVVRVSGTMRKLEEDAIRRAKVLILAAKREMAGEKSSATGSSALDALFGGSGGKDKTLSLTNVVDQDDDDDDEDVGSEAEDAEMSDG